METVHLPFDVPLLPAQALRAGRLSCVYEHGNLRYIKFGEEEVLRMIYGAVRDKQWATAPYEIKDERIETGENFFTIRYTALYRLNEIEYKAAFAIEGRQDFVSFSMQGEALSDFYRNRIGICVLHPVAPYAGRMAFVKHPDGIETRRAFPETISPHQVFKYIREMHCQTASADATLVFEGAVFETEDQRNWSDYSFKTYSTPLAFSFPVWVRKGERTEQRAVLQLASKPAANENGTMENKEGCRKEFPKIGYERAYGSPALTEKDIRFLRQILFDHYRVVLHIGDEGWKEEIAKATAEATKLRVPVELVVFFSSFEDEWPQLMTALRATAIVLESILLLVEKKPVASPEILHKGYALLKAAFPQTKIGYGTDGFFAELNRNRPESVPFDFVSYSLNPQVHASDTRSLLENLEAQGDTVETAKLFADGKAIFVSPITLKIRSQEEEPFGDEDDRMYTSFGAAWTLLAIKNLAGAFRLTFYQTKSYRGVLSENKNPEATPLYQVLKRLKEFKPAWILAGKAGKHGVLLENEKGERMQFLLAGEQ